MSREIDHDEVGLPANDEVADRMIEPERTPSGYRKFTDAEIEQGRDTLRDEMVNARRDRFFGAYMEKAKKNLKITTRDDVLARVIGS